MPRIKKTPSEALRWMGEQIKAKRVECGLTQQQLADETHRGLRHIQNIEKGLINPSFEVLLPIVRRLGMSADILFYPELKKQEAVSKQLQAQIAVCTDEERSFVLKTVDCMVEQFQQKRRDESGGKQE